MVLLNNGSLLVIRKFTSSAISRTANLSVENAVKAHSNASEENVRIRRQLALAYRLIDKLKLNEGVCNHLTAMAPAKNGKGTVMLVAPGILNDGSALHWSQVTASSLLGINSGNEIVENGTVGGQPEESAACIHLGLRRIQPRAKVIFHTHTDYATALGCRANSTFSMIHQNALRFHNRYAFHQDYGLPTIEDEAESLGKSLADKDVLFMCNHGTLIASPTVHLAFDETYYLERAASNFMLTLASVGGRQDQLKMIPEEKLPSLAKYYNQEMLDLYAKRHFYAYWNWYIKHQPDVFH